MYAQRVVISTLEHALSDSLVQDIVDEIAGPGAYHILEETGKFIVRGLFRWLWDGVGGETGVGVLIDAEFDMYLHHQTERNGQPFFTISFEIQVTDMHIPIIMSPPEEGVEVEDNNGLVP